MVVLLLFRVPRETSSPRCCSCMRLEPMSAPGGSGEGPFAELSDGRMLCMACAQVTFDYNTKLSSPVTSAAKVVSDRTLHAVP